MRRLRTLLLISCLCLTASAGLAEEGVTVSEPLDFSAGDDQWIVRGIAANDLLNIREEPSPLGKTLGRLRNGSLVTPGECRDVEGYQWCRITALDVDDLQGWTPARYLQSLAEFSAEMEAASAETAAPQAPETEAEPEEAAAGIPIPQPAPREEAGLEPRLAGEEQSPPPELAPGLPSGLPPGLEARFAGADPAPLASPQAEEPETSTAPGIAGGVPCARHRGQPMTRCLLVVARTGEADADVTVVWPDGGTRLIEFRDGLPARADAGGELRYTREGTLSMIRIGDAERFEILDALAFGR